MHIYGINNLVRVAVTWNKSHLSEETNRLIRSLKEEGSNGHLKDEEKKQREDVSSVKVTHIQHFQQYII